MALGKLVNGRAIGVHRCPLCTIRIGILTAVHIKVVRTQMRNSGPTRRRNGQMTMRKLDGGRAVGQKRTNKILNEDKLCGSRHVRGLEVWQVVRQHFDL